LGGHGVDSCRLSPTPFTLPDATKLDSFVASASVAGAVNWALLRTAPRKERTVPLISVNQRQHCVEQSASELKHNDISRALFAGCRIRHDLLTSEYARRERKCAAENCSK